jgi:uncharacterized glyoxalase superfamily protein PhnB
MSNPVDPIPPAFDHFIPHLTCDPCGEALEFYKKAFGGVEMHRLPAPDGKKIMHASLRIGGDVLFLADDFPEYRGGKAGTAKALGGTPLTIHRYVADCDSAMKRARDAGATVVMPAADMFWGDRYGIVEDPYGHRWSFGTRVKDVTPAEMQAAMKTAFAKRP